MTSLRIRTSSVFFQWVECDPERINSKNLIGKDPPASDINVKINIFLKWFRNGKVWALYRAATVLN